MPAGRVKCWGDNDFGQLGIGADTSTNQLKPVLVPGLTSVVSVAVGRYSACAVISGGSVKCWGLNTSGQVGDGSSTIEVLTPAPVSGLTSGVKAVSVGEYHACALMSSGRVWCWGSNSSGALGIGSFGGTFNTPQRVHGVTSATQVSAGSAYTCATVAGHAKCWGANPLGQLGDGSVGDRSTPVQVVGLASGVRRTVAGYATSCALLVGGKLKCWGDNSTGAIGNGASGNTYSKPVQVLGMTGGVTSVDASRYFICAAQNGRAKCWGDNSTQQLGGTTASQYSIPHQVSGLTRGVVTVDIGDSTGCALLSSGAEKCWGWNGSGEVGVDSTQDQFAVAQRVLL